MPNASNPSPCTPIWTWEPRYECARRRTNIESHSRCYPKNIQFTLHRSPNLVLFFFRTSTKLIKTPLPVGPVRPKRQRAGKMNRFQSRVIFSLHINGDENITLEVYDCSAISDSGTLYHVHTFDSYIFVSSSQDVLSHVWMIWTILLPLIISASAGKFLTCACISIVGFVITISCTL